MILAFCCIQVVQPKYEQRIRSHIDDRYVWIGCTLRKPDDIANLMEPIWGTRKEDDLPRNTELRSSSRRQRNKLPLVKAGETLSGPACLIGYYWDWLGHEKLGRRQLGTEVDDEICCRTWRGFHVGAEAQHHWSAFYLSDNDPVTTYHWIERDTTADTSFKWS